MKVFSKERFIELLNMDGWTHEDCYTDKFRGDRSYTEGTVGTRSELKYGKTTLELKIIAPFFENDIYENQIEYKKNFIIYDGENECGYYDLKEILSFTEPNGYDAFARYDKEFVKALSAANNEFYKENSEVMRKHQKRFALEQENLKQSLKP